MMGKVHKRATTGVALGRTQFRRTAGSRLSRIAVSALCVFAALIAAGAGAQQLEYPVLFVTQVPVPADFTTIGATFGNHRADMMAVARGGDLWIAYPDGSRRNLTAAAGYGDDGFQSENSIAVRDPSVHWSEAKALFSMVVGSPPEQYGSDDDYRWQIYEITGLRQGDTPVIRKIPGQPTEYNNITPVYRSDDRIIFTSDRPRNGAAHLYPQLDEYELTATNSGTWLLDPDTARVQLLNHAPSGNFTPLVDSFGRVIFTQWDHLQRDQLADIDVGPISDCYDGRFFGTFNWSDESPDAIALDDRSEVFPEPRACRTDLLDGTNIVGHNFNHFFPWQMRQDGSEPETLNHVGRQELHGYIPRSIDDDPNVIEYYGQLPRNNPNDVESIHHMTEDPLRAGYFIGVQAPEFHTHAAGQVVGIDGHPSRNPDDMLVTYVTHPDTADAAENPGPDHSGLYRNPLRLSDGRWVATHTAETGEDYNVGTRQEPLSRYDFRLKFLQDAGNGYYSAADPLGAPITEAVTYWDPYELVSYDGPLWELQPVEVRSRPRPPLTLFELPGGAIAAAARAPIDLNVLRQFLVDNDLAILAARNATRRDDQDPQQPFNLRVPGGTETIGAPGTVYDVAHMQLFQADQLRAREGRAGRRVLGQVLHDANALANNPPNPSGPEGSVKVAADGSVAAFIPADRAMSWHLTDEAGEPVVRERYWIDFQPGEIRLCDSCHGVNKIDQAGGPPATNAPQALIDLLRYWQEGRVAGGK